ncbi:MAG: hypothetical protein V5A47_01510 [Bacteroidales bacterium]
MDFLSIKVKEQEKTQKLEKHFQEVSEKAGYLNLLSTPGEKCICNHL